MFNDTSSSLIQHSTFKRDILDHCQELRWDKSVIDNIWDRNPLKSEVIGRCGEDEKANDHAELTIQYTNVLAMYT